MVTLTLAALTRDNRLLSQVKNTLRNIVTSIGALLAGIDEARAMATRYESLARLSDAELRQRGLVRSDIPRVVIRGGRID